MTNVLNKSKQLLTRDGFYQTWLNDTWLSNAGREVSTCRFVCLIILPPSTRRIFLKTSRFYIGVLITELVSHWPVVAKDNVVDQVHGIAKLFSTIRAYDLSAVREYLREHGVTLAASGPAGHRSYAIVDTVSILRRVYTEWPVRLLHTVAFCLQLDPDKRKSAAQLLRMEFFTAGSFASRHDRELQATIQRRDDGDDNWALLADI